MWADSESRTDLHIIMPQKTAFRLAKFDRNPVTLLSTFSRRPFEVVFLSYPEKVGLKSQAGCLLRRQFAEKKGFEALCKLSNPIFSLGILQEMLSPIFSLIYTLHKMPTSIFWERQKKKKKKKKKKNQFIVSRIS